MSEKLSEQAIEYINDAVLDQMDSETVDNSYTAVVAEFMPKLVHRIAQLEAQVEAYRLRTGVCEWEYDALSDCWTTSCGNIWQFEAGGVEENECSYCMYCGGVIDALLEGRE